MLLVGDVVTGQAFASALIINVFAVSILHSDMLVILTTCTSLLLET